MHSALTLDAVRIIKTIHEKGSFAAAAETLFKVPSALTYSVQKLESDLDVALFDRRGQRAVLTSAGELLVQQGQQLLNDAVTLEAKLKQLESGWETRLTIARDTIIPTAPLFGLLKRFCALDKHVEVSIIDESLGGGWDALHSGRADLAVGVTGELPKGLYNVINIGEIEFVFAVAKDHPLADFVGQVCADQISRYPSIVVADSSRYLPERSSGLFDSKQQIRVHSMTSKIEAQIMGLGVGFVPLHLIASQLREGSLVAKSTAIPRPPVQVYLAYQKDKQGKALQWFAQHLADQVWFGSK